MSDKIGDKKIKSVGSTDQLTKVHSADTVGSIQKVKATSAIGSVGSVSGIATGKRAGTTIMSAAEKEKVFAMIQEESEKLFKDMPAEKRQLIGDAVKMAVDSGIIDEE